jgi:formamidopyrimidine-DNA glycosylase
MDQGVLAGVGNVYRAELLFRHRIHPLRPGRTLRRGQWEAMWCDLVELMAAGVRTGRIDTVRPEHTPEVMGREPRRDDHGGEVYVYRRDGRACHVCGARVRTEVLAGRNSFWCPRCQPVFRSRARGGDRVL